MAIDIPYLSGQRFLFYRNDLIAGRDDSDLRSEEYPEAGSSDSGQETYLLRANETTFSEDDLSCLDILSCLDHILQGRESFKNMNVPGVHPFSIFNHFHRVCTIRDHPSGGNLDCLAIP